MQLVEQARRLAHLMTGRALGHTSLMQEGINNYRGDIIVIAKDVAQARDICHFRQQTRDMYRTLGCGIDQLDRTYGMRMPVAVDHWAMARLIEQLCSEIGRLERIAALYKPGLRDGT